MKDDPQTFAALPTSDFLSTFLLIPHIKLTCGNLWSCTHHCPSFLTSVGTGMASQDSSTLSIGAHSYYIRKNTKTTLPSHLTRKLYGDDLNYIPTTAIEWTQNSFTTHDLEGICRDYEGKDDVWSRDFLSRECRALPLVIVPYSHSYSHYSSATTPDKVWRPRQTNLLHQQAQIEPTSWTIHH